MTRGYTLTVFVARRQNSAATAGISSEFLATAPGCTQKLMQYANRHATISGSPYSEKEVYCHPPKNLKSEVK